jgi:hypothetical protein
MSILNITKMPKQLKSHWKEKVCFIGHSLPKNAKIGDIWFYTVEIMPIILTPSQETPVNHHGLYWLALHPVYVWLFKTFLKLVHWHIIKKYFHRLLPSNMRLWDETESSSSEFTRIAVSQKRSLLMNGSVFLIALYQRP